MLLTSDNEGMPVSLIEAGLAGVPGVATRVGSVAEVVRDGVTGLLAAPTRGELAAHAVAAALRRAARRADGPRRARGLDGNGSARDRLVSDTDELYTVDRRRARAGGSSGKEGADR